MLRRVAIESFFLIRDLEIEFGEGLNVISGETGTGKSMTISAVEFVMGKQGEYPEGTAVEIEVGSEDESLILRREIKGGRSRYFLNGRGTTSKVVRELLEGRISVQGQNEFIRLLRSDFQREILDRFADLIPLRSEFERLYSKFSAKERELRELKEKREEILQRRDFLEFRLREIEEIGLNAEEVEHLRKEAEVLTNLEKIKKFIGEALYHLYDSEGSAYSDVSLALRSLWKLKEHGKEVEDLIDGLSEVKERILDIVQSLREEDTEISPEEVDRINELLFKVQRLEKKYKKSYEEILKEAEKIKEELSKSYGYDDRIEELEFELKELRKRLTGLAEELSSERKKAAKRLEKEIETLLKELNLERAKVKVKVEKTDIGRFGQDSVRILFSSYGGEPKPLEESASGGELMRLFLALSLILPPTETYIFDEVDVGVSGETSVKLAKLLKKLGRKMQMIVITHSAPICAAGDVNFLTEKEYLGDIPYVKVRRLSEKEKLKEVARLMGTATENTIRGAKELVDIISS